MASSRQGRATLKKSKPRVKVKKRQGLPGNLRASKSPNEVPGDRVDPDPERSPEDPRIDVAPGAPTENPPTSRIRSFGVPFRRIPVVILPVPVVHPLPDISGHVHRAVGALVGIVAPVNGVRLATAVSTSHVMNQPVRLPVVPPGIFPPVRAASGLFPLGLCGEAFARLLAVGLRLMPGHADDGLAVAVDYWVVIYFGFSFRRRPRSVVARVRDGVFVDVETVEVDPPPGFFVLVFIASHDEPPGRHKHHKRAVFSGDGFRRGGPEGSPENNRDGNDECPEPHQRTSRIRIA